MRIRAVCTAVALGVVLSGTPIQNAYAVQSAGTSASTTSVDGGHARAAGSKNAFVSRFLKAVNKRQWKRVNRMIKPAWFERAIKADRRWHGKFEKAGAGPCFADECGIRSRNHDAYWMMIVQKRGGHWKIVDAYAND